MKIVVYGINYWPELTGCGKYTSEMALWLAARGHQVEAVTAPPYYPEWQVRTGYSAASYLTEIQSADKAHVLVRRSPLWVPKRVGGLTRMLHLASFALSSIPTLFAALRKRPDLLFVVLPTLATVPMALALARLTGVRVWLHVQDFEVDAAFGLGVVKGQRARRMATSIERALLGAAHRVSSISARMVERLYGKGVAQDAAIYFPNWVDLQAVYPLAGENLFRIEQNAAADDVICLYAGNLGEKQGIEIIIEAARLTAHQPRLRYIIAGSGAARDRLVAQAQGLPNITWLPLQPVDRLNLMLNAADVHLLPQRADASDLVMPSKLTGMLASGRAVLGTALDGTQLAEVLHAVGACTAPGDAQALAGEILALAADPARRAHLGALGRQYAEEHLSIDRIMARFVVEAEACVGRGDAAHKAVQDA